MSTWGLESLVSGGITFGVPKQLRGKKPKKMPSMFYLTTKKVLKKASLTTTSKDYVLLVDDTVRGLSNNAPVEIPRLTNRHSDERTMELFCSTAWL